MTLEEVARYLRVSDRTVYEWASKGTIPGGKIGTSWRFKREDIKRWLDEKLSSPKKPVSTSPLTIESVLEPARVLRMSCTSKTDALDTIINALSESPKIGDRDELRQEIYQRESLMSTAIGFGVGVPHVRLGSVQGALMAVGVNDQDISDYTSLDETPVRIVCMIAAKNDQHAQYLRLLAAISTRLSEEKVREDVLNASTPEGIFSILAG
jgi:PTS system nitrogen regulatory IIA component